MKLLSQFLSGSIVGPMVDGVVKVVQVRGLTEQVLAYCEVIKELAAGTWRPFIARSLALCCIMHVFVTLSVLIYVLRLEPEVYTNKAAQLLWVKDVWKELTFVLFSLTGGFCGLYNLSRHHEKVTDGSAGKVLPKVTGLLAPRNSQELPQPIYERLPPQAYQQSYNRLDGITVPPQHDHVRQPKLLKISQDPEQDIDYTILMHEFEEHEGVVFKIYEDTKGYKTAGMGHKLKKHDPEYAMDVGTPVSKERVAQWAKQDVQIAINDARQIVSNFDDHPRVVKHALVNMAFHMGFDNFSQFKRSTIPLIVAFKYNAAADMALKSQWARNFKRRSGEVLDMIRSGAEVLPFYETTLAA